MTSPAVQQLDAACRHVTRGKEAARELGALVANFDLREAEFRLLWSLLTVRTLQDQTEIAAAIGCSPAQVSSLVEHLRKKRLILAIPSPEDRRRQQWQLTPAGCRMLERVIASVDQAGRAAA